MPHIPNSRRRGHPARPRREEAADAPDNAQQPGPAPHSYGQSAPMPGEQDEHDPRETMEELANEPAREDAGEGNRQ